MVKTQEEYRQILEQRLDETGLFRKIALGAAGLAAAAGVGYGVSNMGGGEAANGGARPTAITSNVGGGDAEDAQFNEIERRQEAAEKAMKANPNNLRKKTANGEVWSNQPLNSNGSVNLGAGGSNAQNRALPSTSTAPLRTRGVPSGTGHQMNVDDM